MNTKLKKPKKMQKTVESRLYQRYIQDKKYVVEATSLEEANAKLDELEEKLAELQNYANND